MWQYEFADFLKKNFHQMQAKNERFSMRAYAQKLGLSPSSLSEILQKKKKLRMDRAVRILEKLSLPVYERNRILMSMGLPVRMEPKELQSLHYPLVSDWSFAAVLFYFELTDAEKTAPAMAGRLGLSEEKISEVLKYLVTNGFLAEENGVYIKRDNYLKTTDGPPSEVIKSRHRKNLEMAKQAVDQYSVDERDITTLVFSGNKAQFGKLREAIRQLHGQAPAIMSEGVRDEIYQMTVAVYPLSAKVDAHD